MKVDTLTPIKNHPHILARFNLHLAEGIIIRDITLMTGAKGRWVSWPSRAYKDKEGKDKYFQYVQLDPAFKEKIDNDIKAQVDKLLAPIPENTLEEIPY